MAEEKQSTSKRKHSEEAALAEFERFAEAMDLDIDERGMDDEDRKGFYEARRIFVKAFVAGRLVVNEKGEPTYSPTDGKGDITFYEPTGASFMASDQKRSGHDVAKMHAIIADMTKTDGRRISQLPGRDYKAVQAIALLFLA